MIDGVYSMYGDFAPIKEINKFLDIYKKLHVYADDAHGMGWVGVKGQGYILSQVELHPKMVLATSLNKAFAAGGGVFVFKDQELRDRVRNCGAAFIFSAPHSIPVLGAAIASAKIFLSEEIYDLQAGLAERIHYCQRLLEEYNLPVVSNPDSPIFFIGLGLVRVGYNMVQRMLESGCYVNLSVFPAVPESCTGLRFTITLHHSFDDIENLVKTLAFHYPIVLNEEGRTMEDVQRAFRRIATFKEISNGFKPFTKKKATYKVQHECSIRDIKKDEWDLMMADKGTFDWEGLCLLESSFSGNDKDENNWQFHYYIIRNQDGTPVCATFFTVTLAKDDTLAPKEVSFTIEQERKRVDPYILTSLTMIMGSILTEGEHLYIDRSNKDWKEILMLLLDNVWKEQDRQNASVLYIRDFQKEDKDIADFFKDQGFLTIDLPEAHIVSNSIWLDQKEYLNKQSTSHRYYIRRNAINFENLYDIRILDSPNEDELDHFYYLYNNVAEKSFEVNGFRLPRKLFKEMASSPHWEFIELKLKNKENNYSDSKAVGMAICYKSKNSYSFLLTGMDYQFLTEFNLYPQILWQITCRANKLKKGVTTLGLTASQNKKKFGAIAISKIGFIQMKDNYNMTVIEMMKGKDVVIK